MLLCIKQKNITQEKRKQQAHKKLEKSRVLLLVPYQLPVEWQNRATITRFSKVIASLGTAFSLIIRRLTKCIMYLNVLVYDQVGVDHSVIKNLINFCIKSCC